MSRVEYKKGSPYSKTPQTSWYLKSFVPTPIEVSDADEFYTLTAEHHNRPDRLSYELYGTTDYWWVFMVRNMDLIKDPVFDFRAGLIIRIPPRDSLG